MLATVREALRLCVNRIVFLTRINYITHAFISLNEGKKIVNYVTYSYPQPTSPISADFNIGEMLVESCHGPCSGFMSALWVN